MAGNNDFLPTAYFFSAKLMLKLTCDDAPFSPKILF